MIIIKGSLPHVLRESAKYRASHIASFSQTGGIWRITLQNKEPKELAS